MLVKGRELAVWRTVLDVHLNASLYLPREKIVTLTHVRVSCGVLFSIVYIVKNGIFKLIWSESRKVTACHLVVQPISLVRLKIFMSIWPTTCIYRRSVFQLLKSMLYCFVFYRWKSQKNACNNFIFFYIYHTFIHIINMYNKCA
jgi:hypothetical protein